MEDGSTAQQTQPCGKPQNSLQQTGPQDVRPWEGPWFLEEPNNDRPTEGVGITEEDTHFTPLHVFVRVHVAMSSQSNIHCSLTQRGCLHQGTDRG